MLIFLLTFVGFALSAPFEGIKDFFNRQGYVVERSDSTVILDLGKGKVFAGEKLEVFKEGKEIVHPVTGEVLGKAENKLGKVEVVDVKEKFSIAKVLEDKGIDRGAKVKLLYENVCFDGSEEGFFKVSSLLVDTNLKKGTGCDYLIREFKDGFGIEFRGKAVAFFDKPSVKPPPYAGKEPEDFRIRARFLVTLPSLPLSADVCDIFGNGKDYLAVLFEEKLILYEILPKDITEYAQMRLPPGYGVNLRCAKLDDKGDVVLVNMVSGTGASSLVVKVIGGTPVIVKKDIPFIMGVLDKSRAKETFVGQKFDARNLWGEVRRLRLVGSELEIGDIFEAPPDFRIDSALALGEFLVFTDRDGFLRVYKKGELVFSEREFDGSYATVELPGTYEDEDRYMFNPRHFVVSVGKRKYMGAIRNIRSAVFKFLDVTKFSEGELYLILTDPRDRIELKKLMGKKFEEAIQAVAQTSDGRLFIVTARTGTLPLQNKGDIYEAQIELY